MKIEDQVTSRELSEQIQELGVEAKGAFEWSRPSASMCLGTPEWSVVPSGSSPWLKINAYTVAELLEMLPEAIIYGEGTSGAFALCITRLCEFCVKYTNWRDVALNGSEIGGSSLAEALAKLLIWCIENGHVTTEEINERCGEES